MISWCKTCGAMLFDSTTHTCPPIWHVWAAHETEEDARKVHALQLDTALEKYAEREDADSSCRTLAMGHEAVVFARAVGNGHDPTTPMDQAFRCVVTGEMVPSYRGKDVGKRVVDEETHYRNGQSTCRLCNEPKIHADGCTMLNAQTLEQVAAENEDADVEDTTA